MNKRGEGHRAGPVEHAPGPQQDGEMVEVTAADVTQADRVAAAAIVRWQREAKKKWKQDQESMVQFFVADFSRAIVQGIWDEHPLVQAFARHRIAAALTATSLEATRIAKLETVAGDGVERYRQALEDVCNPLGYLKRMAEAGRKQLSGMAYGIANDLATVQWIAREALAASSPTPDQSNLSGGEG